MNRFSEYRKLVAQSRTLVRTARRMPADSPDRVHCFLNASELYAEAEYMAGRIDADELNARRIECQDARNYAA